jgi:hypothetical protein
MKKNKEKTVTQLVEEHQAELKEAMKLLVSLMATLDVNVINFKGKRDAKGGVIIDFEVER